MSKANAKPVRRVVTGHTADGRSTVLFDGPAPNVALRRAGNASTLLWVTEECPARLAGGEDRAARAIGVPPPARGTIFRIAEFPPRSGGEVADQATVLADFGIGPEVARGHPPRHPAMHRTRSLDYVVVLEGEICLLLDEGEVRLQAGDTVVQRGTQHAWINRSDAPCRLAMVFVDAEEPPEILALSPWKRSSSD
ncbi:MAG: cupin domain-containing protein [Burkholderiales bacterium]|nr:cupin domain-containing protein [Burkholderiales bacterium]